MAPPWLEDLRTSQRTKVLQGWRTKGYPNLAAEVILPAPLPLVQPGGAARTGVWQRSCCWSTAASQIPSATSPRWTWTPLCPLHTSYSPILGTSPKQAPAVVSPLTAFIQNQDQAFSSNSSRSIRSQGQGGCHNCDLNSCFHTTAFHPCCQGAFLSVSQTPFCPSF